MAVVKPTLSKDALVALIVLLGFFLANLMIPQDNNYSYVKNYLYGFSYSFICIVFFCIACLKTESIRLIGLLVLLMINMAMDLSCLMSTSAFYIIDDFRYGTERSSQYNFINAYFSYEVFCVLYSTKYCINIVASGCVRIIRAGYNKGYFARNQAQKRG